MLHVAAEWKVIHAASRVKRLEAPEKEMLVFSPEQGDRLAGAPAHLPSPVSTLPVPIVAT